MGALIPVGGGADAEIKDRLNKTFSGPNLVALQNNPSGEKLFDKRNHTLARVAYRLGCYPAVQTSTNNSRGKWFYFLTNTLPAAVYNGNNTAQVIQDQLTYALHPANNISSVVFDAVEMTSNNPHYVYPDNATPQIVTGDTAGKNTLSILLVCPAPLDPTNTALTPDQTPDGGEKQLPI